MRRRLALAGLAALLAGCGIQVRLSVAPTIDNDGRVGFEARLHGGFGPGDRDYAITADPYVAVGYYDQPNEQVTVGGGGQLSLTGVDEDGLALFAAVTGGGRGSVGALHPYDSAGLFGFELDIGYALVNVSRPGTHFIIHTDGDHKALIAGLGLRVELVANDILARSQFSIPVYVQLFWGT